MSVLWTAKEASKASPGPHYGPLALMPLMAASIYLVENNHDWDPYQRIAQPEVKNRLSLLEIQTSFLLAKYLGLSFGLNMVSSSETGHQLQSFLLKTCPRPVFSMGLS